VNIMTIHKSKGLEFPVVIYPFVDDNINSTSSNPSWVTVEELGFKAIPNISKIQLSFTEKRAEWSPQIAKLRQEELDKGRLDQVNLNYVAFTRPKQRLYILTKQSKKLEISPINAFLQNDSCKLKPIDNTEGQHWPVVYQLGNPNTRKVEEKNDEIKRQLPNFSMNQPQETGLKKSTSTPIQVCFG
jgi:ATP-dependent exoDNAse (exonuclease V) beta subunit (contains helicase and exonuclease domains)